MLFYSAIGFWPEIMPTLIDLHCACAGVGVSNDCFQVLRREVEVGRDGDIWSVGCAALRMMTCCTVIGTPAAGPHGFANVVRVAMVGHLYQLEQGSDVHLKGSVKKLKGIKPAPHMD